MDNSVKTFKEFSSNKDTKLIKDFYKAIENCLSGEMADPEWGNGDGIEVKAELEDSELYCVVKGHEDTREQIKEIFVIYHAHSAADVLFAITDDYIYIPFEDVVNLEELTEKLLEIYK